MKTVFTIGVIFLVYLTLSSCGQDSGSTPVLDLIPAPAITCGGASCMD